MKWLWLCISITLLASCVPTDYSWEYQYDVTRDDYAADLEVCRIYAAKQYEPGIPAGAPYQDEYGGYPHGYDWDEPLMEKHQHDEGGWHPDRDPDRTINLRTQPRHELPRRYTGYPGPLDYSPHYTDDILEKCMRDRGWTYQPSTPTLNEPPQMPR